MRLIQSIVMQKLFVYELFSLSQFPIICDIYDLVNNMNCKSTYKNRVIILFIFCSFLRSSITLLSAVSCEFWCFFMSRIVPHSLHHAQLNIARKRRLLFDGIFYVALMLPLLRNVSIKRFHSITHSFLFYSVHCELLKLKVSKQFFLVWYWKTK